MVSQANYFRDDISGELFDTPIEARESEWRSIDTLANILLHIRYHGW